ncbi:hypothetical protein O7047_01700 [Pseudenterobacter timonensis]|uniref:Uncharacterized protein n=1 Tax=Pseudenterobacter timonensis TaxID=1755099 RepID=A0AAE4DK19_9ENTR|nr:hypothetical protein [Pseudenterobacter timonensis]MDR9888952.1 hypothetical protein [Pseudenterobacter timonensis]
MAKKITDDRKKNLKVVLRQTITPLTAMKPMGGSPTRNSDL